MDAFSKMEICSICGLSMPDLRLATGTIVSGFQIVDEIGRGGMGIVYKAKQLNLERYVALKILSDELSMDLDFVDRFFSEARAAASLSHPNIVQAFDAGATAEGIYYLAMELIEGETLDRRISREGRLEAEAALSIAEKIVDALNHAWERQKLCHGDIKPDNIILNSSGGAKLADLGLAKSLHEDVEHHHHELMVTPFYAPPELINREVPHINTKSDMYSFGATLYHMLAGTPPFRHQDMDEILRMHVQETPEPLCKKVPEIKKPLSNLVDKLLSKNPEDRPESWEELEDEIGAQRKGGQKKKKKTTSKTLAARHSAIKTGPKHHKSEALPHPGHISAPAPKEKIAPVEKAPEKSALNVPLISFLLGLLVVLSLLVVYALHWRGASGSVPFDKDMAVQEWRDLKTDLEFLPPEKALSRSRAFAEKYKGSLPAGVTEHIKTLERKLAAENKMKKHGEIFEKELNKLASDLRSADMPRANSKQLLALRRRIGAVRAKIKNNESFSKFYPAFKKELLDSKYGEINSVLQRRKKSEVEKRRRQELARRIAARKKAIEARKAKERARQKKLKINAITDRYYSVLADLVKNPAIKGTPVHVSVVFNEWLAHSQNKLKERSFCLDRADFIARAFSRTAPVESVFVDKQEILKGNRLPFEMPELEGYKIEEIDKNAIKLTMKEGKVKFGKKIKWSRIEAADMIKLLKFLFEESDVSGLSAAHRNSILAYLILNDQSRELEFFMANMKGLDDKTKEKWRIVSEDFRIAPAENKAIALWERILESMKNKDYKDASGKLMELTINHKGTLFFERYKTEIDRLLSRFKRMSPEAQALYMTAEFDKAIEAGAPPEKTLNLSMSAYIRYGSLTGIDDKLRQTLEDSRREALSIIVKNIDIKSVSENKLPFYKWEYEPIGEGYAFARFVRKSGLFKRDDPILKYLFLGACIDVGNWKKAGELIKELEDCSLLLRDIGPLKEWAPSLLFGYGAAVERFDGRKRQADALSSAFELMDSFEYGKLRTLAEILALEYAMRLREYGKAVQAAERHDYAKSRTKDDFRVALLNLLAMLQDPNMKNADFKDKIAEFRNIFKGVEGLDSDFLWCDAAAALLEGHKEMKGRKIYSILKSSKPYAKDLCARIAADAVAKTLYSNKAFGEDAQNVKNIESALLMQIADNPFSSALWNRLAAFRLAQAATLPKMERKVVALLQDNRICALQLYPSLLMFNAGISTLKEPGRVEFFRDMLVNFLETCPVASDCEQASPKILYPGVSFEEFSALKEKCSPESAYWLYIFGFMANNGKPSIKKAVSRELDKMTPELRWQEKLLLRALEEASSR